MLGLPLKSQDDSVIEGDKLIAWSDKVEQPVHVRYCYTNIPPPPFLYNGVGLPAAMFTTLGD